MAKEPPNADPHGRRAPTAGAHVYPGQLNVFFVTVCAMDRVPWMNQEIVVHDLMEIWRAQTMAWWVGEFLIMPDHMHLFCAPRDPRFGLDAWIAYWKSCFIRGHLLQPWLFQRRSFHHRLRSVEAYRAKWHYVQGNPVRAGLASDPESWPFQGRVHVIWGGEN